MKNTKKDATKVLLPAGILIGAVLGAVGGILLAPASGKETRKKLAEVTERLKKDLEKKLSETKELTEESYSKIVDTLISEYSKKEPVIKDNAKKIKEALRGKFKFGGKDNKVTDLRKD